MEATPRSPAFDDYWRFAAKRHEAYLARAWGCPAPWTDDPILEKYRFTNTYRAADRVTQYLISNVQYGRHNDINDEDIVFRTLLFKIFNNINTWETIEHHIGQIRWSNFDFEKADILLENIISSKKPIYSAAYIMPPPPLGAKRKHTNHLRLIKLMMDSKLTQRVTSIRSLSNLYQALLAYPGLGPFLAFQFAIDLNYTELTNFDEDEFVVAGPGAHDGIRKCFPESSSRDAERIIFWMVENQEQQFSKLGIQFNGLFGRPLKAIDCQNIFCEISKYSRIAHPELVGTTGRSRIKQIFSPKGRENVPKPFFPPKWKLIVDVISEAPADMKQLSFTSFN